MRTSSVGLAALLALALPATALADPYYAAGYGSHGYGHAGYRFAGPALEGAYLGAPFTRLPSTSRLVPPAWGYGTYGVPTVAGIRDAPAARPTLTVIDRPAAARRTVARRGARVLTKEPGGTWTEPSPRSDAEQTGARVVSVRVPAR
ncbi:hypothetical protein MPAR168_16985 [Methylorubrum populi]|uniref:Uncharacterized protein n=1 Tax=Methylobacterium radiotolerans TaxID=31998 RepID=A0ABU7TCL2_9HYPH|nr:hypothetical protein [Methylobacterium sp. B4]PXW58546.1 hypothetical protein BY998_11218 [Methylobacterium sp. B4]